MANKLSMGILTLPLNDGYSFNVYLMKKKHTNPNPFLSSDLCVLVALDRVYKNSLRPKVTTPGSIFQRGPQHILFAAVIVVNLYLIVPEIHGFDESIKQPLLVVLAGHVAIAKVS